MSSKKQLGPNHKDTCDGNSSYLSGSGYNRVRVCSCGAEDHEPEKGSFDIKGLVDEFVKNKDQ